MAARLSKRSVTCERGMEDPSPEPTPLVRGSLFILCRTRGFRPPFLFTNLATEGIRTLGFCVHILCRARAVLSCLRATARQSFPRSGSAILWHLERSPDR